MSRLAVIAKIDEATCIGCTKCIEACPVDAIIGASKQLHTVIEDYCIGCKLCLPPCPVNCIELVSLEEFSDAKQRERANLGKQHARARKERIERDNALKGVSDKQKTSDNIKAMIAESIARSQQKRLILEEPTLE
jgi:Na+-translocating ferredoxin:NAD+ oxidoreductase subunit B